MIVNEECINGTFAIEQIDEYGLTPLDKKYILTLYKVYNTGPAGLEPLAASCNEDKTTLSEFVEPYLMRIHFILRTSQGRVLSSRGMKYAIEQC